MQLRPLASIEEISLWQVESRDADFRISNLFLDCSKAADWIRRQAVYSVEGDEACRLVVVMEDGFERIFFAAKSISDAANSCARYRNERNVSSVFDFVGIESAQAEARREFGRVGFSVLKSLTRMQRRVADTAICAARKPCGDFIFREADRSDSLQVWNELQSNFDARAEQLPCKEEVAELCASGFSYVATVSGTVVAFLLGQRQGRRGTVRYWFVAHDGRNSGVGGVLMQEFFSRCKVEGIITQELWVIDDNENAINRYEHYGFQFDRLKNVVFIK